MLTRRLVDVSQELIIHDADCAKPGQPIPGMYVSAFMDGNEEIESFRIVSQEDLLLRILKIKTETSL